MKNTSRYSFITLAVGLGLTLALLWLLGSTQPARANPGIFYVAPDGADANNCASVAARCQTIQHAMDVAQTDDEIRVATGVYTGVQARGGMTQVVYISKTVTLRGGYSHNFAAWDPDIYPATLDAQGQGRVVSIIGAGAGPTVEHLILTGGDATGVTTNCPNVGGTSMGCGGGVFVYQAHPSILNNIVTGNVAAVSTGGNSASGGGLCLSYANDTVIMNNLIANNAASLGVRGMGGGLHLHYPYNVLVAANQILSNTATTHNSYYGWGGGIAVGGSGAAATIQENLIEGNRTNSGNGGQGAGIYTWYGESLFLGNRVAGNYGPHAVYLGHYNDARFESNWVLDNHTNSGIMVQYGYGSGRILTLANNIVARSGEQTLLFSTYSGAPLTTTLVHNTLVGADSGSGISVQSVEVTVFLTNTIIANHAWAITNTFPASSTVTADHTLFWANDHVGIPGMHPVFGDPVFMNIGGGYHLGPHSAAIDAGVGTKENTDIDGETRPFGAAPDIGADEVTFQWQQIFLPLTLRND